MDSVFVRNLVVTALIGIHPEERVTPQPIRISFEFATDTRAAAASDDIRAALDYQRAAATVRGITLSTGFQLVETLAERIAERLLSDYPAAASVRVQVEKTTALADAESVGVAITRHRPDGIAANSEPGPRARL
jgi:7,8-dihydroneopterin aldolase/epimerase/oxygenase